VHDQNEPSFTDLYLFAVKPLADLVKAGSALIAQFVGKVFGSQRLYKHYSPLRRVSRCTFCYRAGAIV